MLCARTALCLALLASLAVVDAADRNMAKARSRQTLKRYDSDAIDGGLNLAPLWEPDMQENNKPEHDQALMEDHAKMLKRARHQKKKISWAPFGDYRISLTDLVPKSDPMKPEAYSEAEPLPQSLAEVGLTLTHEQKLTLQSSRGLEVQKQFVYPRLDADTTIFSGESEDVAVSNYLKHGGFRYTVGGKDLVANRAVTPIGLEQCAKRSITYSDHFCPNIRFPQSVPQEDWHPFPGDGSKPMKGISYQYIGAHAKDDLFDPDDYPSDPRAQHFLGAFLFKKEGEKHLEWRCADTGYSFLQQKDLHFHLGAVKNHNKKFGHEQKATEMEKAPKSFVEKIHRTLLPFADADSLEMLSAAKQMSYNYPKTDSLAMCEKNSHNPKNCFEKEGGFSFITAGGSHVAVSATPATASSAVEGSPFVFNSHACPSVLLSEKLSKIGWHPAPHEFAGHEGHTTYMFVGPTQAKKEGVFGTCKDPKAKQFMGAFVFKKTEGKESHFTWRCLDLSGSARGPHVRHDAFRNANNEEQSMVSNMVDDLSSAAMGGDDSAGMVEESIDAIPNSQTITIEEKHDFLSDLKREYPGMKIEHY